MMETKEKLEQDLYRKILSFSPLSDIFLVLAYLAFSSVPRKPKEIVMDTGLKPSTVRVSLSRLKKKELIEPRGKGYSSRILHYRLFSIPVDDLYKRASAQKGSQ